MPRGRGEARLHPNVRNRRTPRRAAWSVTAVHARPLDAPAPIPWSTAPSPTIERIGVPASPPSARMRVTHRQAAPSSTTVTPPEGWSDSAVEPTVRNQSRQQPRTSYAHGGTAAYLLDRQAKNWTYDLLRREPVLHCLSPTASDFGRRGFPDWMQDVSTVRGPREERVRQANQQRRVVPAENGTGWVKRIHSATPTEADWRTERNPGTAALATEHLRDDGSGPRRATAVRLAALRRAIASRPRTEACPDCASAVRDPSDWTFTP